jgi:hypothetical protein
MIGYVTCGQLHIMCHIHSYALDHSFISLDRFLPLRNVTSHLRVWSPRLRLLALFTQLRFEDAYANVFCFYKEKLQRT